MCHCVHNSIHYALSCASKIACNWYSRWLTFCCCIADAEYNLDGFSKPDGVFGVFNALGTVAFAYGGHNVILEIQVRIIVICKLSFR